MNILFFDGFDNYDSWYHYDENSFHEIWDYYNYNTGSVEVISGGLSGTAAGNYIRARFLGISYPFSLDKVVPANPTLCTSVSVNLTGGVTGDPYYRLIGIGNDKINPSYAYTLGALVYLDGNRNIRLKAFPAETDVSSGVSMTPGVDYHLELKVVSTGEVELYINEVLSASSNMGASGSPTYTGIGAYGGSTPTDYISYDHFVVSDELLGQTLVVPIAPSSDGVVGDDFDPSPNDAVKWDKVNDVTRTVGTDLGATYVEGSVAGSSQTFGVTSTYDFAGEALAYAIITSSKVDNAPAVSIGTFISDGSNELDMGQVSPEIGAYSLNHSPILNSLPGGVALTKANFETMEIGLKLELL